MISVHFLECYFRFSKCQIRFHNAFSNMRFLAQGSSAKGLHLSLGYHDREMTCS
jgi:hypothetical protein